MSSRANTANHQLEFNLTAEEIDGDAGVDSAGRSCPICGATLTDRRRDALYCGGPCRAEASRVRRLREGRVVDGYRDLAVYSARRRRTKLGGVAN